MNQRRYDIDALRSIAMFLLIFYHLAISFTSVAPYIAFVQNKRYMKKEKLRTDFSKKDQPLTSLL